MKKSTKFEMFVEAKDYIDNYHSNNPIEFVTNVYIFYYLSGRFPNTSVHDVCKVVDALKTYYKSKFSVIDDLSSGDDELPFE